MNQEGDETADMNVRPSDVPSRAHLRSAVTLLPLDSGAADDRPPLAAAKLRVAGYEILHELGRGGMGVVYKARQLQLERVVALKMILAGDHAGEDALTRFKTEAEAVARLQHPNIVQIFEVGEHGGLPFFSLEFCGGGSLDRKLAGTPLPPKEAAGLVETVARAVHAAHQQKVIHRDLKPANVLLTADGTPKITDFGLAKKLDAAGGTQTGAVMGTPSYMAPEQAGGKTEEMGPACDVYSLGAILYECLTGRPPFKAATALDTLAQVLADDPVPPRQLLSRTPRDLETICLKCLEKQPARRYGTAAELADDLGRWQRGEPIRARPPSLGYVLGKWAWRRRTPLTVAAGMLLLLGAVVAGAFVLLLHAWNTAEKNFETADNNGKALQGALNEKQDALNENQQTLKSLNKQLSVSARIAAGRSDAEYRAGNLRDSLNWMLQAYELAPREDPLRPSYVRLIGARGRGLSHLVLWHDGRVNAVSFSPDGRTVLTASEDKTARLWDAADGKELQRLTHDAAVTAAAFSSDGRKVVTASEDKTARLWEAASGKELWRLTHDAAVTAASFSPDSRTVVTASKDKTARLWDAATGKELQRLTHDDVVNTASFSPDGRTVVTASEDKTARLWDVATGKELQRLAHNDKVAAASFSPDGNTVVTSAGIEVTLLWAVAGGKQLRQFNYGGWVSFSPDGRAIVSTGKDNAAWLWDAALGIDWHKLSHEEAVYAASFSPDGLTVLTASRDHTARLWDAASGDQLLRLTHDAAVEATSFSPDGCTVVTASGRTAQLWDVAGAADRQRLRHDSVFAASFSPDGRTVATAGLDKTARLWDAASGKELQRLTHLNYVWAASFSPDGRTIVTASDDKTARLWDAATGKELQRLTHEGEARRASFSPDGRTVLTASKDKTARLWDAASGKELQRLTHEDDVNTASFSPDGRTIVTASEDKTARLWDVATGKELQRLTHDAAVAAAAFSPDGRTIVTASNDKTARLWDAATGRELQRLTHEDSVCAASFSPDGRTVVTASLDKTARLWEAASGKELHRLPHDLEVYEASFSPDGRTVVTASKDKTARLWDAATGQELQRLTHEDSVWAASFSPDGRTVVTASDDKTARLWDLGFVSTPDELDAGRLHAWVLVRTGEDFTAEGMLRPLSKEEWEQQRRTLEVRGGDWQPPPDLRQWHLVQAADAEARQAWFAARFHLKRLLMTDPNNADLLRRLATAQVHILIGV